MKKDRQTTHKSPFLITLQRNFHYVFILACVIIACMCYIHMKWIRSSVTPFPKVRESNTPQDIRIPAEDGYNKVALCLSFTSKHLPDIPPPDVLFWMPFFRDLIPSFCRTASTGFKYTFYVVYDSDDPLLHNKDNLEKFVDAFNMFKSLGDCKRLDSMVMATMIANYSRAPAKSQNQAVMRAHADGNHFFYRLNDDVRLVTAGWTEAFIKTLLSYKPALVGVVGPTHVDLKWGNPRVLTFEFVHRNHIAIFGSHYPRVFDNWYADEWITDVYYPDRATQLSDFTVVHTQMFGGSDVTKRYTETIMEEKTKRNIILHSRQTLDSWVRQKTKT